MRGVCSSSGRPDSGLFNSRSPHLGLQQQGPGSSCTAEPWSAKDGACWVGLVVRVTEKVTHAEVVSV